MTSGPIFDTGMLALFLQANAVNSAMERTGVDRLSGRPVPTEEILRQREVLRQAAGVRAGVFHRAWTGQHVSAANRQKLWQSLGINSAIGDLPS